MSAKKDELSMLLSKHDNFLSQAIAFLATNQASEGATSYGKLTTFLQYRLKDHQAWLQSISTNVTRTSSGYAKGQSQGESRLPLPPVSWGPMVVIREASKNNDGATAVILRIDGPPDGVTHTVTLESEETALKVSEIVARATRQLLAIMDVYEMDLPTCALTPPEHSQITLLKRYNDVRDVAQQLIGIVADNRSVPVRSLYAEGIYGVGLDD